jgi:predicted DCC family thiol-disulfide oxidoreductase YuxK
MGEAILATDPGTAPAGPEVAPGLDLVFYDGGCGFCHRTVLALLDADPEGALFAYAPIDGETFRALAPAGVGADVPDSIIVRTVEGRVLLRSAGVLHIGRRLGGRHAVLARVLGVLPAFLRDAAYDAFARIRHRLLARPTDACPLVPPELRGRFLA